jgi:hypothetical protein
VKDNGLDETLAVEITERLAGEASIDLQALADARDGNDLTGGDFSEQLLIASRLKVYSVLGLFLDLSLRPLL